MSERTEAPTPKRLRRARDEGDVAVSGATTQAVAFLAVTFVLAATARHVASWAALSWRSAAATRNATAIAKDAADAGLAAIVELSLPVLLVGAAAATLAGGIQTGGLFAPARLVPDVKRLDPMRGLRNLASSVRVLALLRALLGAAVVLIVVVLELRAHVRDAAATVGRAAADTCFVAAAIVTRLLAWAAGLGLALGAVDLLVTRIAFIKRLRMTRGEVQAEHKESEGDPEMARARKRAHEEWLTSAATHAVRRATVIIVNPTHLATALFYDRDTGDAPTILASGQGVTAAAMVRAARAYGVPIVTDVPLAHALKELEEGSAIPEALYDAVAIVLHELQDEATR